MCKYPPRKSLRLLKDSVTARHFENNEIYIYFVYIIQELLAQTPSVFIPNVLIDLIYGYYQTRIDVTHFCCIHRNNTKCYSYPLLLDWISPTEIVVADLHHGKVGLSSWRMPPPSIKTGTSTIKLKKEDLGDEDWKQEAQTSIERAWLRPCRIPLPYYSSLQGRTVNTLFLYDRFTLETVESFDLQYIDQESYRMRDIYLLHNGQEIAITFLNLEDPPELKLSFYSLLHRRITRSIPFHLTNNPTSREVQDYDITFFCSDQLFVLQQGRHLEVYNVESQQCIAIWKTSLTNFYIYKKIEFLVSCLVICLSDRRRNKVHIWNFETTPLFELHEKNFKGSVHTISGHHFIGLGEIEKKYMLVVTGLWNNKQIKYTNYCFTIYYYNGFLLECVWKKQELKPSKDIQYCDINSSNHYLILGFYGGAIEVWGFPFFQNSSSSCDKFKKKKLVIIV